MSIDDQQGAVSLNLPRQRDQLAASLNDFRLVARLASSEVPRRAPGRTAARCAAAPGGLRGRIATPARSLRLLVLRCAASLAELWHSQGRYTEAIEVLEPPCQAVEEGAGTRDLIQARELLCTVRERS